MDQIDENDNEAATIKIRRRHE